MILSVEITEKSFGNKQLLQNVKFSIDEGEKVGLIGRNGIGKSTLFGILLGRDQDFSGEVIFRKGSVIASTQQEYSSVGEQTVLNFILNDLPEYAHLSKLLRELPGKMGENMELIEKYTDALNRFQEKNFHFIEDKIKAELRDFGLGGFENRQMKTLSGGQKRLVDTIKIIHSKADLALVDEPTNFMDSHAKNRFLSWMKNSHEAVLVITHDRDVLSKVDRIIEIRDGKTCIFKGNYDDYLRANMFSTTNQIQDFESIQRRIANLKDKVREYQRMKEKARDPSTIQRFKRLENKSREELASLEEIKKPSFWIDQENVENLDFKAAKSYQKFKAKNVKIGIKNEETRSVRSLVRAENLALGYGSLEDALENKNGAKIQKRRRFHLRRFPRTITRNEKNGRHDVHVGKITGCEKPAGSCEKSGGRQNVQQTGSHHQFHDLKRTRESGHHQRFSPSSHCSWFRHAGARCKQATQTI